MDETAAAKEWFVTHEGKQYGPVSIKDLRYEVKTGDLNPRLDMIWKNGMDAWIPAGELEGLFKKNEVAQAAEEKKEATNNFTTYVPTETPEERDHIIGNWPGSGRGAFIFVCHILPFILLSLVGFGTSFVRDMISPQVILLITFGLLAFCVILSIAVTLKRLQNLGMSRKWFLGLCVPLLSLWVYYRMIACPPGYAEHKKLDAIGWVLAILYWLSTLTIVAAIAGVFYLSLKDPEKFKELRSGKEMQQFSEFMEKARERGEKLEAPEKSKKASPEPTIKRG